MRATLLMLAALGLIAVVTWAVETRAQAGGAVELEQFCAEGLGRRTRLESVAAAEAAVACTASADGRLMHCAVSDAAPDTDTVRYFALHQLCFNPRRDPASLVVTETGERLAQMNFRFGVECGRDRGAQVCNVHGLRSVAPRVATAPDAGEIETRPRTSGAPLFGEPWLEEEEGAGEDGVDEVGDGDGGGLNAGPRRMGRPGRP
jgi:hypothetical protein